MPVRIVASFYVFAAIGGVSDIRDAALSEIVGCRVFGARRRPLSPPSLPDRYAPHVSRDRAAKQPVAPLVDPFELNRRIERCEWCPRLREHCRQTAESPRAAFRGQRYWGRPVPNLLPVDPARETRLLLLGLAPAAHGANRTGRMFTGDRSGDFLFAAMHAVGLCNQPSASHADDGLELRGCAITAAAHCAPPANKPTAEELRRCSTHLADTIDALPRLRAVVTLGRIAHDALLRLCKSRGGLASLKDAPFAHGRRYRLELEVAGRSGTLAIHCTYHPSQQNTFTGRLTPAMLEGVLTAAKRDVEL